MNEQPCGISDLEKLFLTTNPISSGKLEQLVRILQDERNCHLHNWKMAEKENQKLQKQIDILSKQQADNKSGIVDLS